MKSKKLQRREYRVRGPNQLWHVDGNDKLAPYGLYIHGAIDGWSRRLIWLRVASSSKKPALICQYYIDGINDVCTIPRTLRMDKGTENGCMADIHTLLRGHYDDITEPTVIYGSSNHNQRIERFWSYMRDSLIQKYMTLFKDLVDEGLLDTSDYIQIQLVLFCFMDVLQTELEELMDHWNNVHSVRQMKHVTMPSGKPDFLYRNPEYFGFTETGLPIVDNEELKVIQTQFCEQPRGCDVELADVAMTVMEQKSLHMPANVDETLVLYGELYSAAI